MLAVYREDPSGPMLEGQEGRDSSHTGQGLQGERAFCFYSAGQQPLLREAAWTDLTTTMLLWAAGTTEGWALLAFPARAAPD